MAIDHAFDLYAKKEIGETGYGLVARAASVGGKYLTKAMGDYQDAVGKCVSNSSKADVACVLNANSVEELKKCK